MRSKSAMTNFPGRAAVVCGALGACLSMGLFAGPQAAPKPAAKAKHRPPPLRPQWQAVRYSAAGRGCAGGCGREI